MLGAGEMSSSYLPGTSAQRWHGAQVTPALSPPLGTRSLRNDVEAVLVGQLFLQQKPQGVLDMNNVHGIGHRDIQQYNHPKKKHKL